MGKKIKEGEKGEATQYITRSKAIRKLQISLKDFRRLCILKGIYPREPKKKFEGNAKTYYHVKDINYLQHEKILTTFRQIKSHLKKYRKALHRDDKDKAERILKNLPKYTLNHLIKERYPTFHDAIKDLDDPLCLINLFAVFQAHKLHNIPNEKIQTCIKLCREFNYYIIKSRSLKKVFCSIKGIYYQAEIEGQPVTWITPYIFTQKLPIDIDYKIMLTFLEFYETFMKSVNFKLYSSINLAYPPKINNELETTIDKFTYKSLQVTKLNTNPDQAIEDEKYKISNEFNEDEDVKKITNKYSNQDNNLFEGLVFYCNREVPRYSLEFVILSFGGQVVSDSDPEYDPSRVTHVITDRDPKFIKFEKNKEYIQPQWVYDSVNNRILLPINDYAPGKALPPHLSPFVETKDDLYKPDRQIQIEKIKGEDDEKDEEEEEEEGKESGEEMNEENNEKFEIEKEIKKQKHNAKKEAKEQHELGKLVMSRKKQKLYDKAMLVKDKEKKRGEKLQAKKEKLRKMNEQDKETKKKNKS